MLERRKVTEADIKTIHPIITEIWQEVYTPIIGSSQVAYMLETYQGPENIRQEMQQGTQYYLLFLENTCVGYTAYEVKPDYLYLSKIYIYQAYRGQGLMREVFDWYDQLSQELKLKQRLRVNQKNSQAIAVYQHRGFKLIKEDIADIGQGFLMIDYFFEKNCC